MHNLRQQTDGTWTWKYDRRRFQQMGEAHAAERRGLAEGLARVTCPTLVVRGAESDVFHAEDAERLAARLPDSRYVTIPKAGHTVRFLQQPNHRKADVGFVIVRECIAEQRHGAEAREPPQQLLLSERSRAQRRRRGNLFEVRIRDPGQ